MPINGLTSYIICSWANDVLDICYPSFSQLGLLPSNDQLVQNRSFYRWTSRAHTHTQSQICLISTTRGGFVWKVHLSSIYRNANYLPSVVSPRSLLSGLAPFATGLIANIYLEVSRTYRPAMAPACILSYTIWSSERPTTLNGALIKPRAKKSIASALSLRFPT